MINAQELQEIREIIEDQLKDKDVKDMVIDALVSQSTASMFLQHLNVMINASIDLLIQKQIFSKEEYLAALQESSKNLDTNLANLSKEIQEELEKNAE